jgi:hypothetical protein
MWYVTQTMKLEPQGRLVLHFSSSGMMITDEDIGRGQMMQKICRVSVGQVRRAVRLSLSGSQPEVTGQIAANQMWVMLQALLCQQT